MVVTGGDKARIFDVATGEEIRVLSWYIGQVYSVGFSPDGTKVLTGSNDHTARIWDAATGQNLRTYYGHTGE
jgi:WD40 repeat protein